ncbi:MAG: SGNH/GDSL hydrolase family protein [Planctomycetaceae bacterium]|nr:SGNH/GDSL hydrolase family protein [Planctomycetaceae bacterium]
MSSHAADDFYLRDGQRVLFFGDSITQGGGYVQLIDAFLTTRLPEQTFEIVNHGISSETVSGTSEIDHTPRRPDAHKRFARDVAAWKPDVLVACFGMNDGNYHSFDPERFAAYQAGVQRLLKRAADEAGGAKVVLLTPPPFDPYRRKTGDPEARYYGYKFAAIDYDHTLAKYAEWLVSLRSERQPVVDLHTAINRHVAERRKSLVSYSVSPDAIHPNLTGHWLMAQQVLEAWHVPGEVDRAEIDAAQGTVQADHVDGLLRDGAALRFKWRAKLPMYFDEQIDRPSLVLEQSAAKLNRLTLRVTGLTAPQYLVRVGNTQLGKLTKDELAAGVDLARFETLPSHAAAKRVWELVRDRHKQVYGAWRKQIALDEQPSADAAKRLTPAADPSWQAIRDAAQPIVLDIRLTPVAP